MSVSNILDQLATTSSRPRYAFAVLALLAEQAGPTGKTGPFLTDEDEEKLPLREYIGKRLARMSGRGHPPRQVERPIREALPLGTAACREIECPYVEISVCDCSIKKRHTKTTITQTQKTT